MAIQFVDGADVYIEHIVATIFGQTNIGKTSLAMTASQPVLFDFDRGSHRAQNRAGKMVKQVTKWEDIEGLEESDVAEFDTIIVDTVGKCLDALAQSIIKKNAKMGNSGALTLQGWGALGAQFRNWLSMLRGYGKDVVLISQLKEEMKNEDTVYRLAVQGQSRGEITENSDIMGFYHADKDGKRILSFDLGGDRHTKNVGKGLPDYMLSRREHEPEPGKMAEIITRAKEYMNAAAAANMEKHDYLVNLRAAFEEFGDISQFNETKDAMGKDTADVDKALLVEVAKGKGFTFDKKKKCFVSNDPFDEE